MKYKLSFALALAFVCSIANAGSQTTPSALTKRVNEQGAKATVNAMSESEWDSVLTHIDAGNAAWIALVPKLAEGTDGGNSEDLGVALAYALPKNAKAVLSAIDPDNGPVLGVSRVCSAPFIEDTVKDIPAYIKHAQVAVAKVREPSLQNARKACLDELSKP